jgi:hypothetical protein
MNDQIPVDQHRTSEHVYRSPNRTTELHLDVWVKQQQPNGAGGDQTGPLKPMRAKRDCNNR